MVLWDRKKFTCMSFSKNCASAAVSEAEGAQFSHHCAENGWNKWPRECIIAISQSRTSAWWIFKRRSLAGWLAAVAAFSIASTNCAHNLARVSSQTHAHRRPGCLLFPAVVHYQVYGALLAAGLAGCISLASHISVDDAAQDVVCVCFGEAGAPWQLLGAKTTAN